MSILSQLREQVRIERPDASADGQGGQTISWRDVATLYAKVEPLQSVVQEALFADQQLAREAYRITLRYRPDISADMRLFWRGKLLNIASIYDDHQTRDVLYIVAYRGGRA